MKKPPSPQRHRDTENIKTKPEIGFSEIAFAFLYVSVSLW
jgi:hypothetical protein